MTGAARAVVLAGLAFALSGCGSLRVQMDVLNPAVVEEAQARRLLSQELPQIVGSTDAALEQKFIDLEMAHQDFYLALADAYSSEADNLADPDSAAVLEGLAEDLSGEFTDQIKEEYQSAQSFVIDVDRRIRGLALDFPEAGAPMGGTANPELSLSREEWALANLLERRQHRLRELARFIEEDTNTFVQAGRILNIEPGTRAAVIDAGEALAVTLETTSPVSALHQNPYAWAVASAPEQHWTTGYNEVIGSGKLGNINVAVMLKDDRNFSLKGVSFDPSDVALVASKVGTQALLIGAQLAGVRVHDNFVR